MTTILPKSMGPAPASLATNPRERPPVLFRLDNGAFVTKEMQDMTDGFNRARKTAGLRALKMTSGYRTPEHNVTAMMENVKAAGSLKQALSNYTRSVYRIAITNYYAHPTEENLLKVGEVRRQREKVISGGHSNYDAVDYSVLDIDSKIDAVDRTSWLAEQGLEAKLENWDGAKRGKNAHIHVEGVVHFAGRRTLERSEKNSGR